MISGMNIYHAMYPVLVDYPARNTWIVIIPLFTIIGVLLTTVIRRV